MSNEKRCWWLENLKTYCAQIFYGWTNFAKNATIYHFEQNLKKGAKINVELAECFMCYFPSKQFLKTKYSIQLKKFSFTRSYPSSSEHFS